MKDHSDSSPHTRSRLQQPRFSTPCEVSERETEAQRGYSSAEYTHILNSELLVCTLAFLFAVCVRSWESFNFSDPEPSRSKKEKLKWQMTALKGGLGEKDDRKAFLRMLCFPLITLPVSYAGIDKW